MKTLSTSQFLSVVVILAVIITFGTVGIQNATLTISATDITTSGAFTVTSVAGTTATLFAANTTGAITVGGTAQTGAISIGDTAVSTVSEISIGGGDGPKT